MTGILEFEERNGEDEYIQRNSIKTRIMFYNLVE